MYVLTMEIEFIFCITDIKIQTHTKAIFIKQTIFCQVATHYMWYDVVSMWYTITDHSEEIRFLIAKVKGDKFLKAQTDGRFAKNTAQN